MPTRNLIYCADLGPFSPVAIHYALTLASTMNAVLHIVHVIEPMGAFAESVLDAYLDDDSKQELKRSGLKGVTNQIATQVKAELIQEVSETALRECLGNIIVEQGMPFDTVLSQIDFYQSEMLLLGRAHHGFTSNNLGSFATKLIADCPIPVLVLPDFAMAAHSTLIHRKNY